MTVSKLIIKQGDSSKLKNFDFKLYDKQESTGKYLKNSETNTYIFSTNTNKNIYVDKVNSRRIFAYFDNNQPYFLYGTNNNLKGYYYPVFNKIPSNDSTKYESIIFSEFPGKTFFMFLDDLNKGKSSITSDLLTDKGYLEYSLESETIPLTIFTDENDLLKIQGASVISTENGMSSGNSIIVGKYTNQTDKPFVKVTTTEFKNIILGTDISVSDITLDSFGYLLFKGNKLVQTGTNSDSIPLKITNSTIQTVVDLYVSDKTSAILTYGNISNWNVSEINNMSNLFSNKNAFNEDISGWNVSNVTNMKGMFNNALAFNQNITGWNVSNVSTMESMFKNARAFNQNITGWNVSNVSTMESMFNYAYAFNQSLDQWNVSNVTSMKSMFYYARAFNQNITGWNVSNVTSMDSMFRVAFVFNQDITGWNVSNVLTMGYMFSYANHFNQPIGNWNTSNVTNMSSMLNNCFYFNQPIGQWNVSQVKNMRDMFYECYAFNQPIGQWNVSQVTDMRGMFGYTYVFNQEIRNWNVSNVNSFTRMFDSSTLMNSVYLAPDTPTKLFWIYDNVFKINYTDSRLDTDIFNTYFILNSLITGNNQTDIYDISIEIDNTLVGQNTLGWANKSQKKIGLNPDNFGNTSNLNDINVSINLPVILHEILHILGMVGIDNLGYSQLASGTPPYVYTGPKGVEKYKELLVANGLSNANNLENYIPIEDSFGSGTIGSHFEEGADENGLQIRTINGKVYPSIPNEIMTGYLGANTYITPVSLGVLEDSGFTVNYSSSQIAMIDLKKLTTVVSSGTNLTFYPSSI